MFAAQIVVTSELKKKEYLFLRAMKRKLSRELFEECLKDFEQKSGKERMLADVVLEAITSSNIKQIEEWKGSGSDMCKTMLEIMADELEESRQQGRKQGFQQGKQQGLQLGKQQGIQLGKQQGIYQIVENMLRNNMPTEEIKLLTGVSMETLQELAGKLGIALV